MATETETGTATSTATETPTATATPTPKAPTAIRGELFELSFSHAAGKQYLRYYDAESDSLKQLRPSRDWWVKVSIEIGNLGGEPIEPPRINDFRLLSGGEVSEPLTNPHQISWDDVRLRDKDELYWIGEPGYFLDTEIEAGEVTFLPLLFDAASTVPPLLQWNPESAETRRLRPDTFLPP